MKKIILLLFICFFSSSLSAQVKKTTTRRPNTSVKKTTAPRPKDGAHLSKILGSANFNKEVTTSAGASQSNISDLPSYKQEIVKAGIINTNYSNTTSNRNSSGSVSGGGTVLPVVPQPMYNGGMSNVSPTYNVTTNERNYKQQNREILNRTYGEDCRACKGTGKCHACNGSKVAEAFGRSYPCNICKPNGDCNVCDGTGKTSWNR